jgi:CBS domain-containing protein
MTVERILRYKGGDVFSVRPDHTVADAAHVLHSRKIGAAMVCDGHACVGVLSERDIVQGLAAHGGKALSMPVRALMSSPVVTCGPKDRIKDVMDVMSTRRIRHLPVVRDDTIVGMVSIGDVVGQRLAEKQLEAAVLRDFALAASA